MTFGKMLTLQHSGQLNTWLPSARFFHGLRIVVIGRNPKLTLARVAALVVTSLILFHYILLPIRVTGISMLPAYKDRSVNFVNRMAYRWRVPRRGDVVSIRLAEAAEINLTFMKRIVGLPGETVAFSNGCLMINGQPLEEPYLKLPCDWNRPPVKLKAGECFVVGDNRSMPSEDHWFGTVTLTRIVGKVLL